MRFDYALAVNIAQLAASVAGGQPSSPCTPSTSAFRTANYITHGLPQQCLPSPYRPKLAAAPEAQGSQNASRIEEQQSDSVVMITVTEVREVRASTTPDLHPKETQQFSSQPPEESAFSMEDIDSPLDNANFLSFEEWREQNLAKAGQSSEDLAKRSPRELRKRPGSGSSNDLDSLGEDSEIELDFAYDGGNNDLNEASQQNVEERPQESVAPVWQGRSKMAGKTGKERFNYASFDCAATVHKTNREVKGPSAILSESKDSYMLNECRAENKFVIVELCDDILVDTVVLANYEFFSSMFRLFRVSVSDRYPVKASGWKELGLFEGRNSREIQAFLVENPLIWARYLKIDFLTHYGSEFYCPISLLRVHGTTMMEEFRAQQEEAARGQIEDDVEDDIAEDSQKPPESMADDAPAIVQDLVEEITDTEMVVLDDKEVPEQTPVPSVDIYKPALAASIPLSYLTGSPHDVCRASETARNLMSDEPTCAAFYTPSPTIPISAVTSGNSIPSEVSDTATTPTSASKPEEIPSGSERQKAQLAVIPKPSKSPSPEGAAAASSIPPNRKFDSQHSESSPPRHYSSPTVQAQPTPTTQESFYKHIHKRLQLLEANATLSLQYIEDQSRILRDAFAKVEKRQAQKQQAFMEALNATLQAELSGYHQQYDQLWQSTVIELESQRRQSESEILAVSSRLALLADEVIFQKRMSYVQSLLLLVCIALVIFSKSSHLDGPLNHSMRGRMGNTMRIFESPPNSPQQLQNKQKPVGGVDGAADRDIDDDGIQASTLQVSGREKFHQRLFSTFSRRKGLLKRRDSIESVESGAEGLNSPTSPTSPTPYEFPSPEQSLSPPPILQVERVDSPSPMPPSPISRSSPATPTGTRDRDVNRDSSGAAAEAAEAGEDGWKVFGPNLRVTELKAMYGTGRQKWKKMPSPLRNDDVVDDTGEDGDDDGSEEQKYATEEEEIGGRKYHHNRRKSEPAIRGGDAATAGIPSPMLPSPPGSRGQSPAPSVSSGQVDVGSGSGGISAGVAEGGLQQQQQQQQHGKAHSRNNSKSSKKKKGKR